MKQKKIYLRFYSKTVDHRVLERLHVRQDVLGDLTVVFAKPIKVNLVN